MARNAPRLFVDGPLSAGGVITLEGNQAHYVTRVMRLGVGDEIRLFNGVDGEWSASIDSSGRQSCLARLVDQLRQQRATVGPQLVFAPVKKTAMELIVQKATELGVAKLSPVITEFTDVQRISAGRMKTICVEAAEQCGRLDVPEIDDTTTLADLIADWERERMLFVADESGGGMHVADTFADNSSDIPGFVIGPQGGFSESELVSFSALPFVKRIDLGPRILRAETAVAAVLSCWQAISGDWRSRADEH